MSKFFGQGRVREYTRVSTAFTAAFIAAVVLLNIIINAFATRFSWYFYTTEQYTHSISGATDRLFADVPTEKEVDIIFCMNEEEMENDSVYSLVWSTANQLADRYGFVSVSTENIYLNPDKVRDYKYTPSEEGDYVRLENGTYVQDTDGSYAAQGYKTYAEAYTINKSSVIFVQGDQHVVQPMSAFFILDSSSYIEAYNGEEIMAAMISWVLHEEHPIAYFTTSHNELASTSFLTQLLCAGYEVRQIDLALEELDEKAELVVISNPSWDFLRAAEGSGIISELEQIDAFLARGGSLYVSLDPYISNTVKLEEFLAGWGLAMQDSIVRDQINSITYDGYTLLTEHPTAGVGADIAAVVAAHNPDGRVILKSAAPLSLNTNLPGITVSPVLLSSPTSQAYQDGTQVDGAGGYTLAALAQKTVENGKTASVFLVSSVYMTATDTLETNSYSNEELLYAVLEQFGCDTDPIGCTQLAINSTLLENLTMGEAHLYALLLVGLIPLLVAGVGVFLCVRRRNR